MTTMCCWTVSSGGDVDDAAGARAVLARYHINLEYAEVHDDGTVDLSGYDHPRAYPKPEGWDESKDDVYDIGEEWEEVGLVMLMLELAALIRTPLMIQTVSAEDLRGVGAYCWIVEPGAAEVHAGGLPEDAKEAGVVFTRAEADALGWPTRDEAA